ncbi:MAG TPA: GIY-YIG nuclease family protein [Saprospiraceae bacterium]|nr:GIY-YIG nuclease family protein [Saprospiraceae bacterium]
MNTGHIYFLLNPSMPGLLKIGYTTKSLQQRLSELETTGVPEPFILGASYHVKNAKACEQELHKLFEQYRKSQHREFFHISLSDAISKAMPIVLNMIHNDATEQLSTGQEAIVLTFEESEILVALVHDKFANALAADELAREIGVHVQKILLSCARLIDLRLIRPSRGRYSGVEEFELTHKGRQYCFDTDIVITEILEEAQHAPPECLLKRK